MNRYRSHKVVEAAPIMAAERTSADGPWRVAVLGGEIIEAPNNLFARGIPDWIGDAERAPMLVRYEDGFISWSPRTPFEEGYRAVPESHQQRVVEERDALAGNLERLTAVLDKPFCDNFMRLQAEIMGAYVRTLDLRIAAFSE